MLKNQEEKTTEKDNSPEDYVPAEDNSRDEEDQHDYNISLNISCKEIREGFKLRIEKISTSPSGRHLGNSKTLLSDNDFVNFFILQCILPLQYSFAPDRWTKPVQLML